jgi:hypothetical protein
VELLVVIGIIALLISILLPVLNKARDFANSVKCLAELKQLGTVVQIYSNDNKGLVPIAKYNDTSVIPNVTFTWEEQLLPYLHRNATNMGQINRDMSLFFACPEWKMKWSPAMIDSSHLVGYGLNILPKAPTDSAMDGSVANPVREINWYEPSANSRCGRYFKISEFTHPSERALFADCRSHFLYYNTGYPLASRTTLDFRHNRNKRANILKCDFSGVSAELPEAWAAVRMKPYPN